MKQVILNVSDKVFPPKLLKKIMADDEFKLQVQVIQLHLKYDAISRLDAQTHYNKALGDAAVRIEKQRQKGK